MSCKKEGVETRDETPARGESIVRAVWRHTEIGRNVLSPERE